MANILELATQLELEPEQIEAVCSIFGMTGTATARLALTQPNSISRCRLNRCWHG